MVTSDQLRNLIKYKIRTGIRSWIAATTPVSQSKLMIETLNKKLVLSLFLFNPLGKVTSYNYRVTIVSTFHYNL